MAIRVNIDLGWWNLNENWITITHELCSNRTGNYLTICGFVTHQSARIAHRHKAHRHMHTNYNNGMQNFLIVIIKATKHVKCQHNVQWQHEKAPLNSLRENENRYLIKLSIGFPLNKWHLEMKMRMRME